MKFLPLLWAALFYNRLRTVLTFFSIVVAFLLLGLLHGVAGGFDAVIQVMSNSRVWIQSRAGIMHPLPLSQRAQIEGVRGITTVVPYAFLGGFYQEPKNQLGASALDAKNLISIFPEIELPAPQLEAMVHTRTAAIVGIELAHKYGWKIGDRIPVRAPMWLRKDGTINWTFDIVGIYGYKNSAQRANEMWVNYDYFDSARALGNNTVMMYTAGVNDPSRVNEICRTIDTVTRNSSNSTQCQTEKDWLRSQIRDLGNIAFLTNAIIVAVLFTLLALTASIMMQSVRERFAQIAILKTLGFSNGAVAMVVASEALLLCLSGAFCGLVMASVMFPVLFGGFHLGVTPPMPFAAVVDGIALAIAVAIISAILPVWRALRLSVVDALAGRAGVL
jgi:putative ABC transport system permease protein